MSQKFFSRQLFQWKFSYFILLLCSFLYFTFKADFWFLLYGEANCTNGPDGFHELSWVMPNFAAAFLSFAGLTVPLFAGVAKVNVNRWIVLAWLLGLLFLAIELYFVPNANRYFNFQHDHYIVGLLCYLVLCLTSVTILVTLQAGVWKVFLGVVATPILFLTISFLLMFPIYFFLSGPLKGYVCSTELVHKPSCFHCFCHPCGG